MFGSRYNLETKTISFSKNNENRCDALKKSVYCLIFTQSSKLEQVQKRPLFCCILAQHYMQQTWYGFFANII